MAATDTQRKVTIADIENEIDRIIKDHYSADSKINTYIKSTLELLLVRLGGYE